MSSMSNNSDLKTIALFTAVALATVGIVLLAWQFSSVLAFVGMSLAVAAMLRAPADLLVKRGVPQGLALALVYAIGFLVIIGVAWFVLPRLAAELQVLAQDINAGYTHFQTRWMAGNSIQQSLARRLPGSDELSSLLMSGTGGLTQLVLGATLNVFDVITQSLLVIVISLYWSADKLRIERLMLSLIASEQRTRARTTWREIESGLGAYLRSEVAQSLLAGALLTVCFLLLGVRYPITQALLASLAWLLPLVGGVLAVIPVLLIGLFISPLTAVLATLVTLTVFAFLEFVVERKLYPRERYGSVLVLLITLIMVEALGVAGLLVAPPLAAAMQIAMTEWLRPVPVVAEAQPDVSLEGLKVRLAEVQARLDQVEVPSPRTQNLLARLTQLVAKVEHEGLEEGLVST